MKKAFFLPTISVLLFLTAKPVAAGMKSTNYELLIPNLNFTDRETAVVNLKTIMPFSFSVSNQGVEFDSLDTSTPKIEKTIITVSNMGAGGYQITVQENHELTIESIGAIIPNVAGDNNDITESIAGSWTLNTKYGFGYSLYGSDVVSPFPNKMPIDENYTQFKQFADTSKGKLPQILMSSGAVGQGKSAVLVYKINISGSQPAGRYRNVIKYVATPTY